MSELELKIQQLIKDQILITESEAQDLATLICNLPEIKGGRVGAEVKPESEITLRNKKIAIEKLMKFINENY